MSKYQALIDALNGDDSLFSNVRNGDVRALLADLEMAEKALREVDGDLALEGFSEKGPYREPIRAALAQMAKGE